MKSLVSVIVPTCNRPAMLMECLRSIDRQTYEEVEIVIVNDGGEPVCDIVRQLGLRRAVQLIAHARKLGPAAARNSGIRAANGTYIAYLDDDDVYYPDHLEVLVNYLELHSFLVAYSDAVRAIRCKADEGYLTERLEEKYCRDFAAAEMFVSNYIPVICLIHHKNCCIKVGYFDESLTAHEDWDFLIRLSEFYEFGHVRKNTCEYRWRYDGSSATSRNVYGFLRTTMLIHARYFPRHRSRSISLRQKLFIIKRIAVVGLWNVLLAIEKIAGLRCHGLRRYLL